MTYAWHCFLVENWSDLSEDDWSTLTINCGFSLVENLRTYLIREEVLDDHSELGVIEQNKSTLPEDLPPQRIVLKRGSHKKDLDLSGNALLETTKINCECISENIEAAMILADDVKNLLHGVQGTMGAHCVASIFVTDHNDDYEPYSLSEDEGNFVAALEIEIVHTDASIIDYDLSRPNNFIAAPNFICEDLRTFLIENEIIENASDLGVISQSHSPLPDDFLKTRIIISRVASEQNILIGGGNGLMTTDVDIDILSEDVDAAEDLADAITELLHGYHGNFGDSCGVIFVENQDDDYEPYNLSEDEGIHSCSISLRILM